MLPTVGHCLWCTSLDSLDQPVRRVVCFLLKHRRDAFLLAMPATEIVRSMLDRRLGFGRITAASIHRTTGSLRDFSQAGRWRSSCASGGRAFCPFGLFPQGLAWAFEPGKHSAARWHYRCASHSGGCFGRRRLLDRFCSRRPGLHGWGPSRVRDCRKRASRRRSTWICFRRRSERDGHLEGQGCELERLLQQQRPALGTVHPTLRPERRQARDLFPDAGAGAGDGVPATDLAKLREAAGRPPPRLAQHERQPRRPIEPCGRARGRRRRQVAAGQELLLAQTCMLAQLAPKPTDPLNAALAAPRAKTKAISTPGVRLLATLMSSWFLRIRRRSLWRSGSLRLWSWEFRQRIHLQASSGIMWSGRFLRAISGLCLFWPVSRDTCGNKHGRPTTWLWNLGPLDSCSL